MNKQHEDFKLKFPNGGLLFTTIPAGEAVVVQVQVFSNYPNSLIGSAQALVTDPDDFEAAEEYAASLALTRAGFLAEVTETEVEVEASQEEETAVESSEEETEAEPVEEEVAAKTTTKVSTKKASSTKDIMNKYSHLMGTDQTA